MRESEIIGIEKIVFYPQEVYALHYKGSPFSISNLSWEEQRKLGVQYPSRGTVTRKCYFTAGHAKTGIKFLPKSIRDQVEIVKYCKRTHGLIILYRWFDYFRQLEV